jgi:hypothetical protein
VYESGEGEGEGGKFPKLNSFHFSCRYKRNEVNKQIENFNLISLIPKRVGFRLPERKPTTRINYVSKKR